MRKIAIFTLAASVILTATGCLKDKGFEDQKYGIQITESKAVSFPEATASPLVYGINSQATPQIVNGPQVTLEHAGTATSDVKVTLTLDPSLVTAAGFVALPVSAFTVNSLTVTIPAGAKFADAVRVSILNSTLLDPTQSYGVGFKISTVDQGYKIASNTNTCVVAFNIKNKYDGKYTITWTNYHPTSNPGYTGSTTTIEMHTSGANSCKMFFPLLDAYCMPAVLGGSVSAFGAQEPNYTVDPTTNVVTVQNVAAGATTFYSMALGYNSRYDPAAKKFYVKFGYGSGGPYPPFSATTTREWTQEFTYTGPR